jgi:hypothetical protein
VSTNRDLDALHNLADALSEDIVNAPGGVLMSEVFEDFGNEHALADKFDKLFGQAKERFEARREKPSVYDEEAATTAARRIEPLKEDSAHPTFVELLHAGTAAEGEVEREASRAVTDAFGELLQWHLDWGTRPGGRIDRPGKRWTTKAFAKAVGHDELTIRCWLETIERVLFGNDACFAAWRVKLRLTAIFSLLAERFPAAFFVCEARRRPLKFRIAADICEAIPGINKDHLQWALAFYCGCPGYLRSMSSGAVRVDLAGEPVGIVTDKAAAKAKSSPLAEAVLAAGADLAVGADLAGELAGIEAAAKAKSPLLADYEAAAEDDFDQERFEALTEHLTFGKQLQWHLYRGTRPGGTIDRPGKQWSTKAFAEAVGRSERTIRHWLRDRYLPVGLETIERVLFGLDYAHYPEWRLKLRSSLAAAMVEEGQERQEAEREGFPFCPRCDGRAIKLRGRWFCMACGHKFSTKARPLSRLITGKPLSGSLNTKR